MGDLDLISLAIHEAYGPPCDDFDPECVGCQTWAAFGRLRWQPIETAPKDGTMFLVRLPRIMNLIVRARYNTVHKYFVTDCENAGAVSSPTFFHEGDFWMPLPEPSEQNKNEP